MRSVDYDWYSYYISKCSYSEEAYEYLHEAADDPTIDVYEFALLTKLIQDLIDERKLV